MPRPPGTVEKARASLPPTADAGTEVDWVSSHPLFFDVLQNDDFDPVTGPPRIKVSDIFNPINGKAPSQRAVNLLITYTRSPKIAEKFVSQILGEQKKKVNAGTHDLGTDELPKELHARRDMLLAAGGS